MKQTFVKQVFLFFSIVFLVGIIATTLFISSNMMERQIQVQTEYEKQILSQNSQYLNQRLSSFGKIIANAYIKGDEEESVAEALENNSERKSELIEDYLNVSCMGNPYVNDMILVDYQDNNFYFKSKNIYQVWNNNFDFINSDFLNKMKTEGDELKISKEYIQEYYLSPESVISLFINIKNLSDLESGDIYGTIIINVKAEDLFEFSDFMNESLIGDMQVVDESDRICFSTAKDAIGKTIGDYYQLSENNEFPDRYSVNKYRAVSWSGFTYMNVIDTAKLRFNTYIQAFGGSIPIVVFILLLCFVMSYFFAKHLSKRITGMVKHMKKVQNGDLDHRLKVDHNDEISVLENGLNDMSQQLKRYIDTIYVKELEMKKSELRALQIQINPHFMFNTLESIRGLAVAEGNTKSAHMLSVLGDMFRWNLRSRDMVTLEEELEYVDYYIQLQEVRFVNRLEYIDQIPHQFWDVMIPKMTLQPIIENAVNHAFDTEMPVCRIEVDAVWKGENSACIYVLDNGKGMSNDQIDYIEERINTVSEEENLYHIGLKNVNQRIKILLGNEYGIHFIKDRAQGTKVEIMLKR